MNKGQLELKTGSLVKYKGLPFTLEGFNNYNGNAILSSWIDVDIEEIEDVTIAVKPTIDARSDENYLYHRIHKAIREEVSNQTGFTKEDLDELILKALEEETK